jgi:cell division protein YceG involved in septum cleavage
MSSKTKIALAVLLGFIFISSMPFLLLYVLKRTPSAVMFPPQVKITIPEGYSVKDIAEKFVGFKNFNKDNFLKIANGKEGYLFPDTYFFT